MRSRSLGLGVLSILTSALLIGACSASGSGADGDGSGGGTKDASTVVADGSPSYGDASNTQTDSGAAKDSGKATGIDSGGGGLDSGPPPSTADCDLSGSGVITYLAAAQSSSEICGAADSCGSGECCVNFAALFAGGGSLPPAFAGLFTSGSASKCVAN